MNQLRLPSVSISKSHGHMFVCSNIQITEAIRLQMEVQRRLQEQLEVRPTPLHSWQRQKRALKRQHKKCHIL